MSEKSEKKAVVKQCTACTRQMIPYGDGLFVCLKCDKG